MSHTKIFKTYKTGDLEVSISKKWENQIVEISKTTQTHLKNKGILTQYNSLWDIFCPSESASVKEELKQEIENKIRKKYWITDSTILPNVEDGEDRESFTLVRRKDGKIIRRYWIKKFGGKEIVIKEHVEAKWSRKIYDLKSDEVEDALILRKLGVKTPEFIARLKVPKRGILISAYERALGFTPVTKLIKSLSPKEKQKLIKNIHRMGKTLIEANALPSIFRSNEILVSEKNQTEFLLTDTAIGMAPISRNKLFLLEALNFDKTIKRPNWDLVHEDTRKFLRYWNILPKETRKIIQTNYIESVLDEITTGQKANIAQIRERVNELIIQLFPNSKTAKTIQLYSIKPN